MPHEHLEQGRLAGAVGAHQADAGVGGDEPVKIVEEKLGAEAFAGGGELDHDKRSEAIIDFIGIKGLYKVHSLECAHDFVVAASLSVLCQGTT